MDKTNYAVLSLVAIVAITAIVSMFLSTHLNRGTYVPVSEGLQSTAHVVAAVPRSAMLTGNVVNEQQQEVTSTSPVNPYDLTSDGELNADDADLLGLVIDRVEFCPRNKRCDLNNDRIIDVYDLGVLNAEILRAQVAKDITQQETAQPSPSSVSAPLVRGDDSEALGTFGAVA